MKQFKYTINGSVYKVTVNKVEDTVAEVEVNGTPYKVLMDKPAKKQVITVNRPVQTHTAKAPTQPVARPVNTGGGGGSVKSPLPGVILSIDCQVGDTVKKGQRLFILEAMKMENTIPSDRDGIIAEIKISKGDSVLEGADLIVFK